MSERYSRVYVLPQAVYAANTPVIISAGALLEDHVNKNILAQLKFTNICSKHVKAVKVRITCLDAFGVPLGDPLAFQYLELNAGMGESFGQKTPIPVPNSTARIIQPEITGIIFADNSTQSFNDDTWMPIPTLKSLQSTLGDTLAEQYRYDVSDGAKYEPIALQGLWICTCGTVNQTGEHYCYSCRTEKAKQFLGLDRETLRKNREAAEVAAEIARKDTILAEGKAKMVAHRIADYELAIQLFQSIPGWKDANDQIEICFASIEKIRADAEIAQKNAIYNQTKSVISKQVVNISEYQSAIAAFNKIRGWKDTDTQIIICQQKIEELKIKAEEERLERERKAEIARVEAAKQAKRKKMVMAIVIGIILIAIAFIVVLNNVIIPNSKYNDALALMNAEKYQEAMSAFESLDGYKDSDIKAAECHTAILDSKYIQAIALMDDGQYKKAEEIFVVIGNHKDSNDKLNECIYQQAVSFRNDKNWDAANPLFEKIKGYKDSAELIHYHNYQVTDSLEATCTSSGYKTFFCACEDEYTDDFPALGHNYSDATCTISSQCANCGITAGSPLGHTTGTNKCTRCNTITFTPLTWKSTGDGSADSFNIYLSNLPKGNYVLKATFSKAGYAYTSQKLTITKYGGWSGEKTLFDGDTAEIRFSCPADQNKYFFIVIFGYNIEWEITIEAI